MRVVKIHGLFMRGLVLVFVFILAVVVLAAAQTRHVMLTVAGRAGEASVIQRENRLFVDVQDLARITNSSLSFNTDRVLLTLPGADVPARAEENRDPSAFSRPFMRAAIEAMGAIREWGGMLLYAVQSGYPLENTTAASTILAYQGRAADKVALASAAASTDADNRGLELLRNEFNNLQGWAERFAQARAAMRTQPLTKSDALKDDADAQKLMRCGQFLARIFAAGTFQDDEACH